MVSLVSLYMAIAWYVENEVWFVWYNILFILWDHCICSFGHYCTCLLHFCILVTGDFLWTLNQFFFSVEYVLEVRMLFNFCKWSNLAEAFLEGNHFFYHDACLSMYNLTNFWVTFIKIFLILSWWAALQTKPENIAWQKWFWVCNLFM